MKRYIAVVSFVLGVVIAGCAGMGTDAGWTTLLDGTNPSSLNEWNRIGEANWRVEDGAVVADKGKGNSYLVSKRSFTDFQVRVEFWADHTTNSGVHFRVQNPADVRDTSSYEANVFDQRPDPSFGTGGIVHHAKVSQPHKAGGKWNIYVITAQGPNITVDLNGVRTVTLNDTKYTSGPFALQYGANPGGAVKFRKVQVKPL